MSRYYVKEHRGGGRRLIVDFGLDEEDAYQAILRCLKSVDSFLAGEDKDRPKKLSEIKIGKRRNADHPLYKAWYKWLDLKKEIYPNSAEAHSLTGEDLKLIGDLIRVYDEEMVPKIFEVGVKDWPAMRKKYGQRLPEMPTLREIYKHREELANAALRGGITVAESRVSRYAKDRDPSYWERK